MVEKFFALSKAQTRDCWISRSALKLPGSYHVENSKSKEQTI